jgi:hypothetical protein
MRRLMLAAVAAVSLAGAGSLAAGRAEAMPLVPAPAGSAAGQATSVRLVCEQVWNGFSWTRRCYDTRPRYYAPPPRYYGPRPYHPRPRYYY